MSDPKLDFAKVDEKLSALYQRFSAHSDTPEIRNEFANLVSALFSMLNSGRSDLELSHVADLLKELAENWKSAVDLEPAFQQMVADKAGVFFPPSPSAAAAPTNVVSFRAETEPKSVVSQNPPRAADAQPAIAALKTAEQALLCAYEHCSRYDVDHFGSRHVSDILNEKAVSVPNITRALESLQVRTPKLIEVDEARTDGRREKVFTLTKAGHAKAQALLGQVSMAV